MKEQMRAFAWLHFNTALLGRYQVVEAAKQADAALGEFDKRDFFADEGPTREELEQQLAVVTKARALDDLSDIMKDVALPGESLTEAVQRVLKERE